MTEFTTVDQPREGARQRARRLLVAEKAPGAEAGGQGESEARCCADRPKATAHSFEKSNGEKGKTGALDPASPIR
jgi:hypothetical protein